MVPINVPDTTPVLDKSYQHFVEFLCDPEMHGPVLSPKRFSQALRIDLQTLADQAHVHRNTISRAPTSQGIQRFLRDALRAIKAGSDISGDVGKALFWYRNDPLSVFGYKTPEQLVSEGRTEDLLRYVASIEAGAVG